MNKTVTINLSGIVFHIDENAYDTLKKYIESIRSKFTVADGRDEIVADIEARIAEMFQQRISDNKQAILPDDVDAIINALGKPEDISNATETPAGETANDKGYALKKRFFRNPDDKFLAGVCGGISAYFDIDPIWLRLAFALSLFFAGGGFLLYIILWIIIPMAKTPSDKLQMRGEDVTLSAIQKSVQEELEGVKNRADEFVKETRVRNIGERVAGFVKEVLMAFIKVIGKLLSFIAIFIGIIVLFTITVLLLGAFGVFGLAIHNHLLMMVAPRAEMIWGFIGLFLVLGIPAALLFLLGIKWMFKINWNLRKAAAILSGLILIGVGIWLIVMYNISKYYSNSASVYQTVAWQVPQKKVLHIRLNNKNIKESSLHIGNGSFYVNGDADDDSAMHCDAALQIEQSNSDSVELSANFSSKGETRSEAYILAQKIEYNFNYTDTTLILDPYFTLGQYNAWRVQKVKMILRIPVNTTISFDKNLSQHDFNFDIEGDDNMNGDDFYGHTFTMTTDGLKCDDCNDKQSDSTNETHKGARPKQSENGSPKLQFKNTSYVKSHISFVDYLKETIHPDDPISFPVAVVKATAGNYSDSFIAYLKNTVNPDDAIGYVDELYNTGKTYASLFNDYIKGAINPDDSVTVPVAGGQMAFNAAKDFVDYIKTTISADEAINYTATNEAEPDNVNLVLQ